MYFAALFNYHLPCDFASFKDVFFYENCMKCFFAFYLCSLMVTWVALWFISSCKHDKMELFFLTGMKSLVLSPEPHVVDV